MHKLIYLSYSFVDRDIFMRYRGGGVGHQYMREIETWLAETGWGSDITPTAEFEDDIQEDAAEDQEPGTLTQANMEFIDPIDNGEDEIEGSSEEEEEDLENGTDLEESDSESVEGDAAEETLDGEYRFSGF